MRTEVMNIAETSDDLAGLPVGSWILTKQRRAYELEQIEPGRHDSGDKYWIEPGTLQPFPVGGLEHWFPAIILP